MVTGRKLELLTSPVSTRKPYATSLFAGWLVGWEFGLRLWET